MSASLTSAEIVRLRALPYAERHPRIQFPGDKYFTPCAPCAEVQRGSDEHDLTLADHPCWKLNAECICGCAEVIA